MLTTLLKAKVGSGLRERTWLYVDTAGGKVRENYVCVFPKNQSNCRTQVLSKQKLSPLPWNAGRLNNWKRWVSIGRIWDLHHRSLMTIPHSSASNEAWSIKNNDKYPERRKHGCFSMSLER